jgi:SAM-dependent methyltransferase
MSDAESKHWWFCSRRIIISSIIKGLNPPANIKILEVGCGTGGNLEMLARFGQVSAFEMDANARDLALKKTNGLYEIKAGFCPDNIPFGNQRFDLICMFDVLEHIEQDAETLVAIKKLLAKNGRILISVPSYQWMYGPHDEFLHHKRRYSAVQLRNKVEAAGLRAVRISYFNAILFPVACLARFKDKLLGKISSSNTSVPKKPINKILQVLFSAEKFLLKRINFPFGLSILCIIESVDDC